MIERVSASTRSHKAGSSKVITHKNGVMWEGEHKRHTSAGTHYRAMLFLGKEKYSYSTGAHKGSLLTQIVSQLLILLFAKLLC